MLRWLALGAFLLSGCVAAPQVPPALAAPVDADGVSVVAVRVEPLVHEVEVADRLVWRTCTGVVGSGCHGSAAFLGGSTGYEWESDTHDYADAQALFWRIALDLQWDSEPGPAVPLRMAIAVTEPCGALCVRERVIESLEAETHIQLPPTDIYLEPGETGLRVRIEPVDGATPTTGDIHYELQGYAAGFRAAGAPILLE